MISMTHDATREIRRFEDGLVRTLVIHLGLEDMAVGANVFDLIDSGRDGAVVSMACGTRRRT